MIPRVGRGLGAAVWFTKPGGMMGQNTAINGTDMDAPDYEQDLRVLRAHLLDVYAALGVKWGDDPFARIRELQYGRAPEALSRSVGP